MKYGLPQAALWLAAYLALAAAPMLLAYLGPLPAPRDFWVELSVGLGFVGLAMMGLQFVLTGRFRGVAATLGLDAMLQFHRQAGLVAFSFILAHPLILFATDPAYLAYLDPRVNFLRAVALSAVLAALALLIVTTFWRRPLGLSYEYWRAAHGILALFVMFVGLVHILQVGFYVSTLWKQLLWVGMTGAAMLLLVNTRVIKPYRLLRRPYRVAAVEPELADAWTLVLEPEGHAGMTFAPGQFVWLTLGKTPFSLQQHPFSISSSPRVQGRLELTIKALGDFTRTIGQLQPGTRAYLEGPYGAFTPDPEPARGAFFIAGGVGITPVMSMLRTFRDDRDPRPLRLIYGNRAWDGVLFREELAALQAQLDLEVVHVLEEPPEGWDGEVGRVTPEVVARHLPLAPLGRFDYFVCGPERMMDAIEPFLKRRGVPLRQIYSERFAIV
jgi:predicted ferric reductase